MDLLKLHLYARGKKGSGITPSGIIAINENGDHDVTEYASAAVNVPVGVFPEGDLNIVENGSYDVTQYVNVNVEVSTGGSGGGGAEATAEWFARNSTELTSNATKVGTSVFEGDSRTTKVSFPAATLVESKAFKECSTLVSADFPAVESVGDYAFQSCTALANINAPLLKSTGIYAFHKTAITVANFPEMPTVNQSAFAYCSKLISADLPSATVIKTQAFQNCTALVSINFPMVTELNANVLEGCTALTTADFPNVNKVYGSAFLSSSSLTAVILRKNAVSSLVHTSAFNGTPIASGTGYIYVPAALLDQYKAATNWSTYAAQFRALEDYTVDGTTTGALDLSKI